MSSCEDELVSSTRTCLRNKFVIPTCPNLLCREPIRILLKASSRPLMLYRTRTNQSGIGVRPIENVRSVREIERNKLALMWKHLSLRDK